MTRNASSQFKQEQPKWAQWGKKYRRAISCAAALMGSAAIGALSATSAFAEVPTEAIASEQVAARQARPTLSELIDSVPERPIPVLAPVEAAITQPGTPLDQAITSEVATEAIRLVLSLSERRVYVYRGDTVENSYPVAVGRKGWETPVGEFEVFHQVSEPGWTNPFTNEVMGPGPNNPLGDRWIAFWTDGNNSIGFHGTPNRESVGKAASHGCVRMYNEDVKELYEIVAIGTPVTVEL